MVVESLSIQSGVRASLPSSQLSSRLISPFRTTQSSSSSSVTNGVFQTCSSFTSTYSPVPQQSKSVVLSPLYAFTGDASESSSFSKTNTTTTSSLDGNLDGKESATASVVKRENDLRDGASTALEGGGLLPSYKQLIAFTATTILIWLSEPLLSLVDTTIVGLKASAKSAVVQIAALGPATTLFDSLIYTTYFLAIATTNQLAPDLAAAAACETSLSAGDVHAESNNFGNDDKKIANATNANPWRDLRTSTSHLLGLAIFFGSVVSFITFIFGKAIIGQMIGGSSNIDAAEASAIVPLATNYARIRAIVAPFSIVGFVAQSFCLANLDIATPAIAVAAASFVNLVGDLALSGRYGIQGAAVATALATVTSCFVLLRKVRKTTNGWKLKQEKLERVTNNDELTAQHEAIVDVDRIPSSAATELSDGTVGALERNNHETKNNSSSSSNNNNNNHNAIPFWSIPDKRSMINLFKLAGPIFFVSISKVLCYNVMTVRATTFGIVPLASHNIMLRVFFFFACFGDSLSQAAQSFYPQVAKKARGKLIRRLFTISTFVGVFNNQASQMILKKFGRFLTHDSRIIETMSHHAPWVGLGVMLHPFILLFEGTVLANRDLVFLVGTYTTTVLLHLSFVFSPVSSTFWGLWRALFGFQVIRLVQFAARIWLQSRESRSRSDNNASTGNAEQEGMQAPPL
eukprot:CAMPEP_0172357142 /NCGR_PEP_ID=MMETSP1060-20121228/1525_1 /TAXON_ID=37318 /ORGANISM="Pseudo-nitzschia pungens, Strain cf. cingulata" /LENGTH=688 /DNA_ID=CAMNT_0013077659 /DNA_START=308 /DNA_END=2374 /DNA_ORIENTATION=+